MFQALKRVFSFLTQTNPNVEQDVDTIIAAIGGSITWWKPGRVQRG